jgi:glycosyltransferase involved in cell wall biosynthesis
VRILFVGTDFVWPPVNGGRIRVLSQLRAICSLEEVESVRFFSLREDEIPVAHRDALAAEVPKLEVLEPVFHPIHLFSYRRYVPRVAWLRVARGVPYLAGKWESPVVRRALERELLAREFDVVWLGCLGMVRYLPLVRRLQPRARVVLDQIDVESEKFAQFMRRQRGVRRAVAEVEWRAARAFERDALRAVDAVGAISEEDARWCEALADVPVVSIPQIVPFVRRAPGAPRGPRVCYAGNLKWRPNVRGLDWFCQEVWPLVREQLPDATFDIAGTRLPVDATGAPVVPAAWRGPGITTLGFVEDLGPLYEASAAMVAPSFDGTGVRLKLLEAFRCGVPLVTTPDGAFGLAIEPGREAFVESEPRAFADRVVELATSPEVRARLREAAYGYLEHHHGLAAAQAVARELLGSAAAPSGVGTASSAAAD